MELYLLLIFFVCNSNLQSELFSFSLQLKKIYWQLHRQWLSELEIGFRGGVHGELIGQRRTRAGNNQSQFILKHKILKHNIFYICLYFFQHHYCQQKF